MNIIREFLSFRRERNKLLQIDLTDSQKTKLEAVDKDLIRDIIEIAKKKLVEQSWKEEISRDYANWYTDWLYHLLSYFKKYK